MNNAQCVHSQDFHEIETGAQSNSDFEVLKFWRTIAQQSTYGMKLNHYQYYIDRLKFNRSGTK